MATKHQKLNVYFLPYFTTSHLIPLVDTARLLAASSTTTVSVTIITTPANALLFKSSIDRDTALGHQITVLTLKFPSAEVGLPEGIENFSGATSNDIASKIARGISLLQEPVERLIREGRPNCIVSDMFYPWTVDIANQLNIPRLVVHASNCFFHLAFHNLKLYAPQMKVSSETETFLIPDIPDEIEMKSSELEEHLKTRTKYGDIIDEIKQSEKRSYGIIFTSFSDIEPVYVDLYKKVLGIKCWHLGLPSLSLNRNQIRKVEKHNSCLNWLDNQKRKSVLYICFGSMVRFSDTQLAEIALALENSSHQFVWVVRKREKIDEKEEENWLPDGFEERMRETNKGIIIRGWAPQKMILEHASTGGFMTHCGWNSILEAIAAGVPLITWPLFAEQFHNEKLITRVMKIGVGVGSEVWNNGFDIKSPVVGNDKIVKAVSLLMGSSEEVLEIRRRAEEFSGMVKRSVEEGGSSYNDLNDLIEEIKACAFKK